ncbi:MAG: hypothetical protein ACRDNJ_00270 [Solirubrobacteraceae bacterium]
MLLRHRPPGIESVSSQPRPGLEHLDHNAIAVLQWLNANRVDYVLVGPVAHAIRGDTAAAGPVAIVPAPYSRNWERLTRALVSEHAGLRGDRAPDAARAHAAATAVRLTPDKLARGRRWLLSFGEHDLDIEGAGIRVAEPAGDDSGGSGDGAGAHARTPRYQELLYEANRFEVVDGVSVEVASPADLEHYSHLRRTGVAPEFRVIRAAEPDTEPAPSTP